jgi:hypothetical protein
VGISSDRVSFDAATSTAEPPTLAGVCRYSPQISTSEWQLICFLCCIVDGGVLEFRLPTAVVPAQPRLSMLPSARFICHQEKASNLDFFSHGPHACYLFYFDVQRFRSMPFFFSLGYVPMEHILSLLRLIECAHFVIEVVSCKKD